MNKNIILNPKIRTYKKAIQDKSLSTLKNLLNYFHCTLGLSKDLNILSGAISDD